MAKKKTLSKQFADIKSDYEINRISRNVRRRTGVAPRGSGADYHFRTETKFYDALEQSRDMFNNDALMPILADRRVDNIVQSGFKLDPKTGDKKLDLDLWQRFYNWADDPELCDITGEMCFLEQQRAVCRAECVDGDIVAIGTVEGSLQLVEAHLIQTRTKIANTFLGVTTNSYGRRTHYYVIEEKDKYGTLGDATPIPVRDESGRRQIFHVYNPNRVLQTRGVPMVVPVATYASILEDINFAKLVQQQSVSCWAILHEYAPNTSSPPKKVGYGDTTTTTTPTGGTRTEEGVGPGMEYHGAPGESLKGFSPNIPNNEYFQQVRLILQVIGVNFGLPLCLVLMDGSETNFSGWRGAVDEARKGFVADQLNLVRRFHKPVYEWWLTREMESDPALRRAAASLNIYAHNWNLPTWSYIEPVADAEGDATQLRNALTSRRRLHAARGQDWEETAEEIIEDNLYAIEAAAKKAAKFNDTNPTMPPLTWRDLVPLTMPEGQTLALQDPAVVAKQEDANATGEAVGLGRREESNRQKGIDETLRKFAAGTISEQRARLDLDSFGIPPAKIDAYILDASDGVVEELVNA